MIPDDCLKTLACPTCDGTLDRSGAACLECASCRTQFPFEQGIPSLLLSDGRQEAQRFAQEYTARLLNEGWRRLTEKEALELPFCEPRGYPPLYWMTRRQSYLVLCDMLRRERRTPADTLVVDLGAGMGWLSRRLAEEGYRTIAVDLSLDPAFGLGAIQAYFHVPKGVQPLQANLEWIPFHKDTLSLVIANASLHYAQDLDQCMRRIAASLVPGGRLFIMDTPISADPRPGAHPGDRLLGRREVEKALELAGFEFRFFSVPRGWKWRFYWARRWVHRQPLFSFPIILASKVRAVF